MAHFTGIEGYIEEREREGDMYRCIQGYSKVHREIKGLGLQGLDSGLKVSRFLGVYALEVRNLHKDLFWGH